MALGATDAASLIGALGLGSFLTQALGTRRDRRSARANVLEALGQVETMRWSPNDQGEQGFPAAARRLMSQALVAQVPRAPMRQYLVLAQAAAWLSRESYDEGGGDVDDGAGGILADFAKVVRDSCQLVADTIWAPRPFRRWRVGQRVKEIEAAADAIGDDEVLRMLARSRDYGFM